MFRREVPNLRGREQAFAAFEEAVAPYEKQVYHTCLRMMGSPEDAQDCAQEAMLKAFRGFSRFEGRSKLSTWLYSIAANVCVDALRKRREALSLDVMRESGWEAADETPDAYERLEQGERRRLIREALREVPPDFRAVLILVDLEDLNYQEAAEALALPLGTVKSRISRARNMLMKSLLKQPELFEAPLRHKGERRDER